MNRDEIMKLTAEEMRMEIARLKGWKLIYMNVDNPRVWASLNSIGATRKTAIEALQVESEVLGLNTNWPTDIAAAWELVEEMGAHNWSITIENLPEQKTEVICRIFQPWHTRTFMGAGDTAPLAICRAWLIWKENT